MAKMQGLHPKFSTDQLIAALQDERFELKTIERIVHANNHDVKKHNFSDFATTEDKEIVREAKDWDISDDELFE